MSKSKKRLNKKPNNKKPNKPKSMDNRKPCVDVELFAEKKWKQANLRGMRFCERHSTEFSKPLNLSALRIAQLAERTTRKNILKMGALSHALGSRFCEDLFGIICDFAAYFVYSSFSLARFVANGRVQVEVHQKPRWISLVSNDDNCSKFYLRWKWEPHEYVHFPMTFSAADLWGALFNFSYSHHMFLPFLCEEDALRRAFLSAAGLELIHN